MPYQSPTLLKLCCLLQVKLIQFFLNRSDGKSVLLSVCRQMLTPGQQSTLNVISQVYDMLNQVYKTYLEIEVHMIVSWSTWSFNVTIVCYLNITLPLYVPMLLLASRLL